ncbi:hypothetical protein AQUCO_00300363v1 [Aquilegia coerulea]|uniref:Receptor-like serine/threonine-protein kinase n=1 Tax=Aquilegia coerulea TaxID=218851 RepID=A0A2G5EYJ4_AQUCA|nr:hypothetical protein AQUCO_00300363v1 [Aquilegia coerulea]
MVGGGGGGSERWWWCYRLQNRLLKKSVQKMRTHGTWHPFLSHLCFAADTISSGQSLTFSQTLISKGGKFELGFFTPGTSLNYYIGIWYKNVSIQTVVWVANRDTPLIDSVSLEFKLLENGNLVLLNQSKLAIWSTESKSNVNVSYEGVLGDDGNFVLRTGVRPSDVFWQSFDYPTDTFLPGAKIGYNRITNKQLSLTSWKNSNDPARGLYSLELDRSVDQYFIQSKLNRYWNSGEWNGQTFSLVPEMRLNFIFNFSYFKNENESYFTYSLYNTSIISRLQSCLNDCSCSAFAFNISNICLLWNGDLFNQQQFQDGDGGVELSIQLRLAASEIQSLGGKKPLKAYVIVLIAGSIFISILVCFLFVYKIKQRGKIKYGETSLADMSINHATERGKLELPAFDFNTVAQATNNFSNKLGQGGFGSVYKGKLLDGREIAVKRLSTSSVQGVQEFKNELVLISKLQHRNLVRLLGYCIGRKEKMLLYEYMPNKSLDVFLFDPTRQILLGWEKRFNIIIDGIARGLMYLHRDSRLKVIHRDLKASNILLDEDMNPKISDFGMARIFGGKQTLANTNRIVGTYGYMSPEYAMEGIFSEKSDVFSFGVLLLEIVSGRKNRKFYFLDESYNLLGYVWQKWNENKVLELMDPTVAESYNPQEFVRCIHIGLLCVQENAHDRPIMSTIVFMLGSEGTLPLPKRPAFTIEREQISDNIFNINDAISTNSVTITNPQGR